MLQQKAGQSALIYFVSAGASWHMPQQPRTEELHMSLVVRFAWGRKWFREANVLDQLQPSGTGALALICAGEHNHFLCHAQSSKPIGVNSAQMRNVKLNTFVCLQISSVEPLQTTYHSVHDIFLDYNEIESIDALASEGWLEHFRVFSLRGNQLTKLPVYVLNNALERNRQVATLYLSENPWRCECVFTVRFQDLLQKYHTIINDASNVTCKYIEGDDNFGKSVLALKRGDVCKLPTEYRIRPLDLLNGVLASLIILIFSKLAYDYYHYRKSGRLPWIVTKMP